MPCCAQFPVDDLWYRGQINKLKGGKRAEVYFVDLGYKEVLPLCRIRPIEQDLLKQSAQAIHCSLKDIVAPSVWPANILHHFEGMTIGKELALLGVHGKTVTLQYVDFGTSGSLSASKIKVLQPEFGALPCQAFECSLERSCGVSDVQFKELVSDREFEAQIVAVKKGEPVEVKRFALDTGEPIVKSQHKTEAEAPFQVPKAKLNMGETKMMYISVIEGVARFYGQLVETLDPLNRLMVKLEKYYNCLDGKNSIPRKVRANELQITKVKEDNSWYHALVTGVSDSLAEVLYIDYGNRGAHQLHELRILHHEFAALPAQAAKFSLSGIGRFVSKQLETRFKELALERQLVGKTIKQGMYSTYFIMDR